MIDKAENLQKFGVFGNYKEADGEEFGSNWFNNQPVTYSSKDAKWTYSPVQYWLPQGHIDFLAYAPYAAETTLKADETTSKNTCIDFTVAGEVANQKDLLWANAKDQTKDNIASTNNKVKFQFNHALSRLGYTVKLKEKYTGTTIKLTKITLAGSADGTTKKAFYTAGTIDLSNTSSSSTDLWTISNPADKQNFDWFSGEAQSLATTPSNNTEYLFVIPQKFSAPATDELYVIVEYTIEGPAGVTKPMTNKVYKKLEKNFEQGKAYTINLTIGLTPIDFDADVTPWADGGKEDITWN